MNGDPRHCHAEDHGQQADMNGGAKPLQWLAAMMIAPELRGRDKARLVAVRLVAYADGNGRRAFPGRKKLAEELGVSLGTIDTALRLLRDTGWIVRVAKGSTGARKNYADVYDLAFPASHTVAREHKNAAGHQPKEFDQSQSRRDQSQIPPDQSQLSPDQSQPRVLPTYSYTPAPSIPTHVSTTPKKLSEADASGPSAPDDADRWFNEAFEWVEAQVHGFDGFEASTATGMLYSGSHPKAIVNTLWKRR